MAEKAYIVSRGAYSDYRVVAVFTEEEKADEYAEQANDALNHDRDYDSFRVEEQRLNPEPEDYNKYAWAEADKKGKVVENWGSRNIGASGRKGSIYDIYKIGFGHKSAKENVETVSVVVEGHDTDKAVRKAKEIAERAQEEGWWGDEEKLKRVLKREN